jgi:hypothetical protein
MDDRRPLPARHLRDAVEGAARDGATLREIERDVVESAALAPEARAALWLYAWGAVERRRANKPVVVVETESGFGVR